jgi:serine/threonine-protein kinase
MGRGPMSVDYQARDPATDRTIVLTVPSAEAVDSPNLLRRFYREARAAGSLKHPNIVAIYDLGVDRGNPYITRELLEGEDLWHILERKKKEGAPDRRSSVTLLDYVLQACRGLGYAHQQGIIHRDVRPGIIFVTSKGQVKLTQFVHARLPEAYSPVSDGHMGSSMDYMSPEQVRGDRLDRATDIWSMGCVMFELLTYTKPFQGATANAQMIAIMSQEPKPIGELRPDLPAGLDNVLRQALKKDRAERYRNMEDLVAELEPIVLRMEAAG